MRIETADDIYSVITTNTPDTIFAKRIWEGLANAFYQLALNDPLYDSKKKLETVLELAKQYDVQVPSDQYRHVENFMKASLETGGTFDSERIKDLEYEFSRTVSRESAENL
jgi:hypothetical protein